MCVFLILHKLDFSPLHILGDPGKLFNSQSISYACRYSTRRTTQEIQRELLYST